MEKAIINLRMERQHLTRKAGEAEYLALYRDTQPGQNVYWNGFGCPPTLSFRVDFDDLDFNRRRQLARELVKGRFAGGNLGWVLREEMGLFAALYRKPLAAPTGPQQALLERIRREGPVTIQQLKEETGLLVKEITPALHRLQEAFLVYEDQYDGQWDRGWYVFEEMFPHMDREAPTRGQALKTVLERFAYRMVWFDPAMAKNFYKLPGREIRQALGELAGEGVLAPSGTGFVLKSDLPRLACPLPELPRSVFAMHRNDILYKANEPDLKALVKPLAEHLPYDHEPLQYLLIDGVFQGAVVGHFRNGPYDLNDVVCALPEAAGRREEILQAVARANFGCLPQRFMGEPVRPGGPGGHTA